MNGIAIADAERSSRHNARFITEVRDAKPGSYFHACGFYVDTRTYFLLKCPRTWFLSGVMDVCLAHEWIRKTSLHVICSFKNWIVCFFLLLSNKISDCILDIWANY